tara:strand:+ start:268 stop:552 length:285 start_codon:yes stop_codon:yes gene_type:complete
MIYEVHPADPEIWNERKWWAVEKFDQDDPMPQFLARFFTEEEAQEFADSMKVESDCKDYIREELEAVVMQAHQFNLSQNEMSDLIRQVADDGGY